MGKSARKVAAELKVSRTAYNNFAHGRTRTQDRVRRPIGLLYLAVPPELRKPERPKKAGPRPLQPRVAERPAGYGPGGLEEDLRRYLSKDPAEARQQLGAAFENPDGPEARSVRSILRRWVEREYPPGSEPSGSEETRR